MEILKQVNDYPNYHISNYGNVFKDGVMKIINNPNSCTKYKTVTLRKKGYTKSVSVHRLVATHFIPNPENKPIINHIDRDRNNNTVENLEWVTYSENTIHWHKTRINKRKIWEQKRNTQKPERDVQPQH